MRDEFLGEDLVQTGLEETRNSSGGALVCTAGARLLRLVEGRHSHGEIGWCWLCFSLPAICGQETIMGRYG